MQCNGWCKRNVDHKESVSSLISRDSSNRCAQIWITSRVNDDTFLYQTHFFSYMISKKQISEYISTTHCTSWCLVPVSASSLPSRIASPVFSLFHFFSTRFADFGNFINEISSGGSYSTCACPVRMNRTIDPFFRYDRRIRLFSITSCFFMFIFCRGLSKVF